MPRRNTNVEQYEEEEYQGSEGNMTVEEAGHKGGQKVKHLVEEGREKMREESEET